MKNLVIRKRVQSFTNKQFDEFMQRVVEVSDSLKNNTLSKYVTDLKNSVKEFHDSRVSKSTTSYTQKINDIGIQADAIFRKMKLAVDYSEVWQTSQIKDAAVKIKDVFSCFGNIPAVGIVKKFVDYDSLVTQLQADKQSVSALKLDESLSQISTLIRQYRKALVERDEYSSSLKGKRRAARVKAWYDFVTLRSKVEAFAEMNGEKDVETFVSLVNEAMIRVVPKVSPKTDNKE
ncbi:MAG: hypothetical protein II956_01250 [Bacteroidales bacterium]|nr:hypothetical protein [Bacteroidales bacterium]